MGRIKKTVFAGWPRAVTRPGPGVWPFLGQAVVSPLSLRGLNAQPVLA